jgi:hypothetical protein
MKYLLSRPVFLKRLKELSLSSDIAWFLGLSIGLIFTLIGAYGFAFSQSGKFWAYASLLIRAAIYLWANDSLKGRGGEMLGRLFQLGIVAGLFEILIDWALIQWLPTGKLVYLSGNDVVLLGSPIWMPLAWACVIVELGYPALRLFGLMKRKMGVIYAATSASLITAVSAGLTVGAYEFFAYRAGWWKYEKANAMIGDFCALYIPLGEFFMFLPVLWISAWSVSREERPMASAISGGACFAVCIAVGYAIAYVLLEVL